MLILEVVITVIISAGIALLLTRGVWRNAEYLGVIDIPNARSSHDKPTPRGGGIAIGLVVSMGTIILFTVGRIPSTVALALICGGAAVMVCGWWDDRKGLSPVTRVLIYLTSAAFALYCLSSSWLSGPGINTIDLNIWGSALAVLGITWLVNLYNFMDGTDGLAAVETITVSLFAAYLFYTSGEQGLAFICVVLFAATAGFLKYNWPPARIFMGDSGSCMIGFCLAVLVLAGEITQSLPVFGWMIMLSLFISDATFTLFRRIICGEKWYDAHRTHAYQLLVHNGMSHKHLTLGVLLINGAILGPLTIYAVNSQDTLIILCGVVYLAMFTGWGCIQYRYFWQLKPERR